MPENPIQPDTQPDTEPNTEPNTGLDHADRATRRTWQQLLRHSDQATIACFLCVGLIGLICWTVRVGGGPGEAIELDRAIERRASFQIDMNHAEWAEWAALPGVGEGIARRVIESRENEGPFAGPDDLMRVKGIGPKTLERIRPYLLPDPGVQNMVGSP